ncbi:hypothetical protein F4778DRAFT_724415 [Xylariomycetidae sp. FL2044]|nr:hypothetical protein F4778DRAFT_724415 [Xylariomycetidae sp. FL2044]
MKVLNDGLRAKYHGKGKVYGRQEFDRWWAQYDALIDVTSFFAPELVAAYPDAKFVLTSRDPEKWVKSVNGTFLKVVTIVRTFPLRYTGLLSEFMAAWIEFSSLSPKQLWGDKPPGDVAAALQTYNDHNETVRKIIPPEQLLDIKLEDGLGWEQICPFLGHRIPDVPYPRGNDPQEFKKTANGILARGILSVLTSMIVLVVPVIGVWSWYSFAQT